jgi:hypothetical protein
MIRTLLDPRQCDTIRAKIAQSIKEDQNSILGRGLQLLFACLTRMALGSTPSLSQRYCDLSLGIKRQECENDHSSPSIAGSRMHTAPIRVMPSIRHRRLYSWRELSCNWPLHLNFSSSQGHKVCVEVVHVT